MELLSAGEADILRAGAALRAGRLVAFPTETVYGLGADAFNPAALAKVFEVKQRPFFDPLIIHIAGLEALERIACLTCLEREGREKLALLVASLWPGPLTLVLPKRPEVPGLATGGLNTVAVRFPDHPLAQQLIKVSTGAVAAPSANPFGCLSPTMAEHVLSQLGDSVDYIIDGGKVRVGVESTVLDLTSPLPRILRPGGASQEDIEKIIGPVEGPKPPAGEYAIDSGPLNVPAAARNGPLSPGQLKSHYAPRTALLLHTSAEMKKLAYTEKAAYLFFDAASRDQWPGAGGPEPGVQWSGAGGTEHPGAGAFPNIRVLSETGDIRIAAANLFALLHELDVQGYELIHAETAPPLGLGPAINDRLSRASAKTSG